MPMSDFLALTLPLSVLKTIGETKPNEKKKKYNEKESNEMGGCCSRDLPCADKRSRKYHHSRCRVEQSARHRGSHPPDPLTPGAGSKGPEHGQYIAGHVQCRHAFSRAIPYLGKYFCDTPAIGDDNR